ncbi:MAG: fasciclin domain-containing protein, partial [Rhodospirillaceae bacterium]
MKKFAGFLSVAVLGFTVVGCSESMSPAAPSAASAGSSIASSGISSGSDEAKGGRAALPTIAGTAVAAAPEFTTLVAALSKAGLVETFNGTDQYTVFAPTNQAFDDAAAALLGPGNTGTDLVNALSVEKLTQVLVYHVAQGDRRAQGVISSG